MQRFVEIKYDRDKKEYVEVLYNIKGQVLSLTYIGNTLPDLSK